MSSPSSTIAAISTPPGVGGIAVIRLSGADALAIAQRHLAIKDKPRHSQYTAFVIGNETIDDVVAVYYQAPHSYTGLDTVEVMCHGSIYVQQRILQALIDSGATLAEPGEFTRQAFLSGRLNLSQAEAVADLIDSTNASSHQLAISQLRGGYSIALDRLRQQLIDLTALLELELDFSEEDVEFANRQQLHATIVALKQQCVSLTGTFQQGNAIKNGIPVAIIGMPNVGKSTLLNALVGDDRAIVSSIAGTTRDTIEETLTLNGLTFRFVDTAGLHPTLDPIEQQGIQRSYAAANQASIILLLVEASSFTTVEQQLQALATHITLADKYLIICFNKCDLLSDKKPLQEYIANFTSTAKNIEAENVNNVNIESNENDVSNGIGDIHTAAKSCRLLSCSFAQGIGIDEIRQQLQRIATPAIDLLQQQQPVVSNLRHYQALVKVAEALSQAELSLNSNLSPDLVAIDLRDALYHLGTITGATTPDDILTSIFTRFCIGK